MLLTAKTAKVEKERLYKVQNGICPLCGQPLDPEINKNHLDHDHALDGANAGKVRALLCLLCNPCEGNVLHKFNRSGLKDKINYILWFKNLIRYWEQDYSLNNIHPKYMADKAKQFGRLSKTEMQKLMQDYGYEYKPSDGKKELINQFKKLHKKEIK